MQRNKLIKKEDSLLSEGQRELHLVQTDGVKEMFELYAREHFPDSQGRFHLSGDVKITIKGKAEGRDIIVKGESGIYEKDLRFVAIREAEVLIEDIDVKSKEIIYTSDGNIKSYLLTNFNFKNGSGSAEGFVYDLGKKSISASNFKGDFKKDFPIHVEGSRFFYSYPDNSGQIEGNCIIKGEEFYGEGEKIYFAFSEGNLIHLKGEGNVKIFYYGTKGGKGFISIMGREGEKVFSADFVEVKRTGNFFYCVAENNCKLVFPSKNKKENGILKSRSINFIYKFDKGVKEANARVFYFKDYDEEFQAEEGYGKMDEEYEEWEIINAKGNVKFQGNINFECAQFSKNRNLVIFEGNRPYVRKGEEIIYANRIEYNLEKEEVKGMGNVKAFFGRGKLSSKVPFFKEGEKIFAYADSIYLNEKEDEIILEGGARIEQGAQFLRGRKINLKKNGYLIADKNVEFLFSNEEENISGVSDSMLYLEESKEIRLSKRVKIETKKYSIKGEFLKIGLDEDERLNFIEGINGVKFNSKEMEGTGEKLNFDYRSKKVTLEGNPSIKDEKKGIMRGRRIFIDLEKEEIKVEGEVSEVELKEKKR
ncbi:MAG: LptA/OstA family protein [Candidatus Aminicenantia bacterium]